VISAPHRKFFLSTGYMTHSPLLQNAESGELSRLRPQVSTKAADRKTVCVPVICPLPVVAPAGGYLAPPLRPASPLVLVAGKR
jgi:hypothetical protein